MLSSSMLHTFVPTLNEVPALIEAVTAASSGRLATTSEPRPIRWPESCFSRVRLVIQWLSRNSRAIYFHVAKVLIVWNFTRSLADKSFLSSMPVRETVSLHVLYSRTRRHVHGLACKGMSQTIAERSGRRRNIPRRLSKTLR